ncbi:MAG: N-acetylmuramoyl-L-alanine amidase [Ignavibacteriales bacterium]|nr:N-acetylmuramoyl-L-alanine amidase [Ignavibacteriales bacterium]
MKIKFVFIFFIIFFSISTAQRLYKITVQIEGREETLSYIARSGIDFASAKEIAALLSANQFYNSEVAKIDIKFKDYTLKFTARNQFVILNRKSDGAQKIFQIPISTILIKDDIFIPLIFCLDYFNLAYGKRISFDDRTKNLKITDESVTSENFVFPKETIAKEDKPAEPERTIGKDEGGKYDISSIAVEEKSNGTLIRLKAARKISIPRYSIGNGNLFVFFSGVSIAPDIVNQVKPAGLVKRIKRTVASSKNIQLEFALEDGYSTTEAFQDVESNDILITIHNKLFTQASPNLDDAKSKWVFDSVVIDAGHGGKDPGAIGVTGVREKDVNLAIALKLGKLISNNLPGIRVIYTRNKDEFIELYKRGKIANENEGKLFLSIHCNSTEQKDISYRGFEVYLLRPGRTQKAIAIAEFENSVIKYEDNPQRYQKLTDENFILVSMAHSQYMRYSESFSDILNQEWKHVVKIPSLGIKQAGFYVLVGASMPGVLIETGFLSNRKDEAFLASAEGQAEIAQAIFGSVKKYKENYEKEFGN